MKKIKSLLAIVAVTVMMLMFSVAASAQETINTGVEFTYTVTDGEATITGCAASVEGHIVIPDSIDGYKVTCIGDKAFKSYFRVTDVTIPETVKTIGYYAFPSAVKGIHIDSTEFWLNVEQKNDMFFTYYGDAGLYINGELLEDIVIPEGVTSIPNYAFYMYDYIRSVSIPESLKDLGLLSFDCSELENVYLPSIESWINTCYATMEKDEWNYSHYGWLSNSKSMNYYVNGELLVDLVIPESVTKIPHNAFYNCKSIESITLHSQIETITSYAFDGCKNIKEVYVPDFTTWSKICRIAKNTKLETIYFDNEPVVDFVVPEGITSLNQELFYNYDKLESITIGSDLKEIGDDCFFGCDNLKDVYVDSLNTWVNLRFSNEFANPMNVADNLYIAGNSIENIVVDEYTTSIPDNAFVNCEQIKSVTLHNNLTSVGENAFKNCKNIKTLTIPDGIESIAFNAFEGCTGIEKIFVPSIDVWLSIGFDSHESNPLYYGAELYVDGVLLENLRVPESISRIKPYAFSGYSRLKTFEITGSPLEIGGYAFAGCKDMEIYAETVEDWFSVKMADSYSNPVGFGATIYIGGKQPEEIVIPEGVKRIPNFAFQNCKSLKKITIPASTKIGEGAFSDSGLEEALIGSLTQKIEPVNEFTYKAFQGCVSLRKVTLGYGVKKIGDFAFEDKTGLKEVVIYSGLEEIGEQAFSGSGITSVTIPSTVKTVGRYAFAYCDSLKSVTLGDSVGKPAIMDIEDSAFGNCPGLTAVTFNSGVRMFGNSVFHDSSAIKDVYVNDMKAYLAIAYPDYFHQSQYSSPMTYADNLYINGKIATDIVIPEGVGRISDFAFYGIKSIKTVKLPSTAYSVGKHAFASCSNLKDVILSESIKTIEESAFSRCSSLTSIKFGKNLWKIESNAFEYCSNIKVVYMYPQQIELGKYAFRYCKNIELILYTGTKEAWDKLLKENKNTGLEGVAVLYRFRPESMRPTEAIYSQQTTDSVTLSWTKINGATGYKVFVKEGSGWKNLKTLKDNTYKVTGLKTGTRYTFAVRAYISSGALVLWAPEYTTHDTATRTVKPSKVTATTTTSSIKLTWPKTAGATGYRIFYKTANGWSVCVSSTTATAHTFNNLKSGLKFTLAVRPYISTNSGIVWSDYTQVSTATQPVKPASVTASQTTSTLKLSWTPCSGATGYRIFRKSGNNWTAVVNNVTATSYSFKNLRAGSKFTLAVRPYIQTVNGVIWGAYTQITTATLPANVTAKVTTPAKGRVTLTWNAVSGADSYLVYYRVGNGAYQLYKTCTGVQNITFNNLKSGAKYTFAVRAITKTSTGNVYGGFNPVTVTVK